MAFAYDPNRTIIVEMGRTRDVSDLAGLYRVKWRQDDHKTRKRLLRGGDPLMASLLIHHAALVATIGDAGSQ